jgi:N-acetylglutamate synthase-like GNAT family acetyltransferase
MEWHKGDYLLSTNRRKLQIDVIHQYLAHESYWAQGIPKAKVRKCIQNSVCFGIYHGKQQIGFCRVVTDFVRFAWLADVFVIPVHRGKELSKWLMEIVMQYPDFQGIRRWMLVTADAHGLYEQFGFTALPQPERVMGKSYNGEW